MTYAKFETIEFFNQIAKDREPEPIKKLHIINFKEMRCFKENPNSNLWLLEIDGTIFRRVIASSIQILTERGRKEFYKKIYE